MIQYESVLDYLMERDFTDVPSVTLLELRALLSEHIDSLINDNVDLDTELTDLLLQGLPKGSVFQSIQVSCSLTQLVEYRAHSLLAPLVLIQYSF